jgi:D-arabinose 1-dehydrogenase-like Zn-dependent alcohol dehydrogenase
VVLAIGGMTSVSHVRRALTPKGTLVIVGGESDSKRNPGLGRQLTAAALSPFVAQRLVVVLNKEHYSGLERLAEAGEVAPCIEQSYPLPQVPDAIRRLKGGDIRGQVVITI